MNLKDDRSTASGTDELCFLTEKGQPWSEVLADVLKQSNIPFIKKGNMGAGLSIKVGPLLEKFQFYVPKSYSQEAQSVVDELFSGNKC